MGDAPRPVRGFGGGACHDADVSPTVPRSIELFAGGGGMSLGLHLAGFKHLALVEWDSKACATLLSNAPGRWQESAIWDGDVRDWLRDIRPGDLGEVDLLAGGPPCQPFSLGGVHNGHFDERNMFPVALEVVRRFRPKAVVFENVPGLLRPSFKPYFDYVVAQLRRPTLTIRMGESWRDHAARLARCEDEFSYRVPEPRVLNSADYGLPQSRRRVFMVGVRSDLDREWDWGSMPATHSEAALTYDQWVEPVYWEEHGLPQPQAPTGYTADRQHTLKVAGRPALPRWRTVRDMLREPVHLPEPVDGVPHPVVPNHVGIPGARTYPGHTGSFIDQPAKTLKAGVHGVCGGEAMIRFPDGSLRYLTVRESARTQGFSDDYVFAGARSTAMRHIGNAVSVGVAQRVGGRLRELLSV